MPRNGKKVSIGRELASARRSLRALEQSLARLAAQVRGIARNNSTTPAGKPRRKLKLLPALDPNRAVTQFRDYGA